MGPTDHQPSETHVERDLQNCKMRNKLLQATKSVISHVLEQERMQRGTAHKAQNRLLPSCWWPRPGGGGATSLLRAVARGCRSGEKFHLFPGDAA